MTTAQLHQLFLKFPTVTTDTRKITKNAIFFALKGDRFNGNTYAAEALQKGAAYVIIDEREYETDARTILVKDVLQSLQELALYHRNQSKVRVIALTGSNGKTTTKELIHAVLRQQYRAIATKGNLNNHIGVPLTLLSIEKRTEIAIVEMGANHQKEIEFLCTLARPDFGYITNFGKAHLEGFGGKAGVIKGKSELYDYLLANDKSVFFNADDPIQSEKLERYPLKYGFSAHNSRYRTISLVSASPFVKIRFDENEIQTRLIGAYNFTNCCAAISIAEHFEVPPSKIIEALSTYTPKDNRSQLIEQNGYRIILDAYNANPSSMKVALEHFHKQDANPKTVVLGDMFELGAVALEEHQATVDMVTAMQFDAVFLIGEHFSATATDLRQYKNFEAFADNLKNEPIPKGNLLIKGSRGMALERLVPLLS